MKMFEKAMGVLGRRPWLPAAVYLVLYGLFVVLSMRCCWSLFLCCS